MDTFFKNGSTPKTKVTILSTYGLIGECLRVLVETDKELKVLDIVNTKSQLFQNASLRSTDVFLICLTRDEGRNIDFISDILKAVPNTKVVVLSTPDSLLDQPAALKLGVTGIVGSNQNSRTLLRAIRQVSDGEVWLNQKLIAQLIGGKTSSAYNQNAFTETDELTCREREVVATVGLGMNNKDISKKLFISEATVRHHLSSIYSKLYIEDRLNLAIFAFQQGIVRPAVKRV
jgi:two-component system, NarL family, response regulator DegU